LVISLVVIGKIFTSCDFDFKNILGEAKPIPPITKTTCCVSVYDKASGKPINSAYVEFVFIRHGSGISERQFVYTATSGLCCIDYLTSHYISFLLVSKNDFTDYYKFYDFEEDVNLIRNAYLKLHVENIEPHAPDDHLSLDIPDKSLYYFPDLITEGRTSLSFNGEKIDTVLVLAVHSGDSYISWRFKHKGAYTQSKEYSIFLNSLDTTFFQIQY